MLLLLLLLFLLFIIYFSSSLIWTIGLIAVVPSDVLGSVGSNHCSAASVCSVCGSAVLLKDEASRKQCVTLCDKTWKQTLHITWHLPSS